MSDIVDGRTGELRLSPAEQAVSEMLAIPSGVYGMPVGPAEIDQMILDVADTIEHIAKVIIVLYERWRPYARALDAGYLTERAMPPRVKDGELVPVAPQVRVTARGLERLRDRLGAAA